MVEQLLYPRFHTHVKPNLILKLKTPMNAKVKLFQRMLRSSSFKMLANRCIGVLLPHSNYLNAAKKPKIIKGAGFELDNSSVFSGLER